MSGRTRRPTGRIGPPSRFDVTAEAFCPTGRFWSAGRRKPPIICRYFISSVASSPIAAQGCSDRLQELRAFRRAWTSPAERKEPPRCGTSRDRQARRPRSAQPRQRQNARTPHHLGGRGSIRTVLYMATLAATRCNPVIAPLYQRLTTAGKEFKVVITACMRKLLILLNSILKTHVPWEAQKTAQVT